MKSFIFATSYFSDQETYEKRYLKWINYHKNLPFAKDKKIILIDDGSPQEFVDDFGQKVGKVINHEDIDYESNTLEGQSTFEDVNLYHFKERMGINPTENKVGLGGSTVGWFRSFLQSLNIAKKFKFKKIIHVESDAYLISQNICDFMDDLDSGWLSMWCPRYQFVETTIQVICEDNFEKLEKLSDLGLDKLEGNMAENILPIEKVCQAFVGDRYGEGTKLQVPDIDYYCQCHPDTKLKFKGER